MVNTHLTLGFPAVFRDNLMLNDSAYLNVDDSLGEFEHHYGERTHLIRDPYLASLLAKFCQPDCQQPIANHLLDLIYRGLLAHVVSKTFHKTDVLVKTRMASAHPEGNVTFNLVDPETKVVCVGLARAGTMPSQIFFDNFNYLLAPPNVRQDHVSINRKTDANEKVIGTNLGGVKIGGGIDNAYVLLPDPMGATGSTITSAIDIYKKEVEGTAKKFVAVHLIVTPEYLKTVSEHCPELEVYALRLDRGLSSPDILKTVPGTHWAKEKGLNDKHYIVPGAGGIGELINNSYV